MPMLSMFGVGISEPKLEMSENPMSSTRMRMMSSDGNADHFEQLEKRRDSLRASLRPVFNAFDKWQSRQAEIGASVLANSLQTMFGAYAVSRTCYAEQIRALFQRALKNKSITAWVCANDDVAEFAQVFLREQSRSVRKRISLLGFDNTYRAMHLGISSYSFRVDALAHMALSIALGKFGSRGNMGRG
ncbi:MAG: hypothetical protein GF398_17620 [Chitinivibrionales bacterium]|nr:hypothetical protein [Chitinivibrionales bacterium]